MKPVLGDYMKIAIWLGGFSWCAKGAFLCCLVGFSTHQQDFSQTVGLEEGVGRPVHGEGKRQHEKQENIFGKMGNAEGIIQGDNSTGHCFVLRDLIPRNIFK